MMATRPGSAFVPPSSPADERVHNPDAMCRYPSKKCFNFRAVKRNGELHNLCDLHRQKANKNQRRLELKRKARALAAETLPGKRIKTGKKPRQRVRKAPLSATLAMQEEARAKRLAAEASATPAIANSFLQDLVLLDGVFDRTGLLPTSAKIEMVPMPSTLTALPVAGHTVKQQTLDHLLLEGSSDVELNKSMEEAKTLPEGKTSPVDVGESWEGLDFSDYWMAPADPPAVSFDPSTFAVDDDVFVADV